MNKELNLEETKQLYDFLRGEGHVEIKSGKDIVLKDYNIYTKKSHLPKLTDEQAFLVIYVLQEVYGVIPDSYEQCTNCGGLYDSYEEGNQYHDENYCDSCYNELGLSESEEKE